MHIKRKVGRKRKNKTKNVLEIAILKQRLKDLVAQAREDYCGNALSRFLRESPQAIWRFFSSNMEKISQVKVNNQVVTCPIRIAEEFNKYFQSVFTASCDQLGGQISGSDESRMSDLVLSESGVFNLSLNINVKKASFPMSF